jgi:plasmid stabilization system protein ParE
MMPTCRLARSARRDLQAEAPIKGASQAIADYWTSEVGEQRAFEIVAGVLETFVTMSAHPRAGVVASQFGAEVRKFPVRQYMIYYRPWSKGIEILHVFHGARDQKKAWKASGGKPPGK